MSKQYTFAVGDRVRRSKKFLQDIGNYSYEAALPGTIIALEELSAGVQVAQVVWDHMKEPYGILSVNLIPNTPSAMTRED